MVTTSTELRNDPCARLTADWAWTDGNAATLMLTASASRESLVCITASWVLANGRTAARGNASGRKALDLGRRNRSTDEVRLTLSALLLSYSSNLQARPRLQQPFDRIGDV